MSRVWDDRDVDAEQEHRLRLAAQKQARKISREAKKADRKAAKKTRR